MLRHARRARMEGRPFAGSSILGLDAGVQGPRKNLQTSHQGPSHGGPVSKFAVVDVARCQAGFRPANANCLLRRELQ